MTKQFFSVTLIFGGSYEKSWNFLYYYTFVRGGLFTSCENFFSGSELRAEIENQVAYANASAYTIRVDYPENSGIIKSPAGGEVSKKVSDVFTVDFEPASDWEFIRWKIIDSVTGNEIPGGEYLSLSALSESKTECTFKKAPSDGMKLCLVPELAERPQIISCSPTSSGMIKNSVIQVLFDRKMDPGSIYYTAPEIKSLKESGVKDEDFLPPVDGTDKNHYRYQKGGKTFFKNISIKNKKTDANLNGCFAAPVFDNESTLSISVKDKDSIDDYTQILVCIEK